MAANVVEMFQRQIRRRREGTLNGRRTCLATSAEQSRTHVGTDTPKLCRVKSNTSVFRIFNVFGIIDDGFSYFAVVTHPFQALVRHRRVERIPMRSAEEVS